MNDINLCYDKKFMANWGYLLYIFKKQIQYLNCGNYFNICPCVKCVKIGCLLSLFKKNRTENVKMLLQNICINNGVTNGLK